MNFLRLGYDSPNPKILFTILDKVNDDVIVLMKNEFANNRSTNTLIQVGAVSEMIQLLLTVNIMGRLHT